MKTVRSSGWISVTEHKLRIGLLLFLFLQTARAAEIYWTNISGGNWNVAANWNPNIVPGAGDTALIVSNGTYNVTVGANIAVGSINIGAASGVQTINAASKIITVNNSVVVNPGRKVQFSQGTLSGGGVFMNEGT